MIPALKKAAQIRNDLIAILLGTHTDIEINGIIELCHAIAVSSINSKIAAGTLNEEFIGLGRRDIAFDCIADLFQRDDTGAFIQLKAYFSGVFPEGISDQELLTHFRRLVFSKVNDGLFRIYNEIVPSLGKIIRGIKVVVSTLHNFDEMERLGESCICPSLAERLEELPTMDMVTLERGIRRRARGTERIPELMAKVSLFLREQH